MLSCPCGFVFRGTVYPLHCKCGKTYREGGELVEIKEPVSGDPAWVIAIRRLRKPEDRGVGDTVQRVAAWFGGELFKAFSSRLGIPCGCTARQREWNERWPY